MKSPLFLVTSLFWAIVTALVSFRFSRWIGYLMQFFPIFPAVMLGGAMLAMLVGLRWFHTTGIDLLSGSSAVVLGPEASRSAFLLTLQWVFAFSAVAGIMGADWGSGSITARDVVLGGWVGMALAPTIVAALGLIAVAGYQGSKESPTAFDDNRLSRPMIQDLDRSGSPSAGLDAPPYTFRALMINGVHRKIGACMLITFGLASLAPAVSSSFAFGRRFQRLGPGISQLTWTMMGTCTAWLLVIGGWLDRPDLVFDHLGALFAPIAGVIAADYRRHRGQWPGSRNGVNPAGLIAWTSGAAVGLTPTIGRLLKNDAIANLHPAALAAFFTAYLAYEILAVVRLESKSIEKLTPTDSQEGL